MKKNFLLNFICYFIFPAFSVFAQNSKIDSLITVLKGAKEDTNKVNLLNSIVKVCAEEDVLKYARPAFKLAEKINYKPGIAKATLAIGNYYYERNETDKAMGWFDKSFKLFEELQDTLDAAGVLNSIGRAYLSKANLSKALENFNKSLKLYEALGDKNRMAVSYENIGIIYDNQGYISRALEFYYKSLKIYEESGSKQDVANAFNNIASTYINQGDFNRGLTLLKKSLKIFEETGYKHGIAATLTNIGNIFSKQKNYKKALEWHHKSLVVYEEVKSKEGIATCFNNIGAIYHKQNNLPEALEWLNKSLKICEETGNKEALIGVLNDVGAIYLKQKKYQRAGTYCKRSLEIAKETGYPEKIRNASINLTDIYQETGDYKNALAMHKLFKLMSDSINNVETHKSGLKKQMQHDFDKKEQATRLDQLKKDAALKVEKQKEALIRNSFICGFALMLLFALVILRSYRQKKKANIIITQQKDEVEVAYRKIEEQKHLVEEKHKEITDSINYAERIQRSFLATKQLLDENLKDHFIIFQPKHIVSGDFYWASKLNNGQFALVIADSTGHGVPGAIMSILNISCLENSVIEKHLIDPCEILNHTRTKIIERLKKDGSIDGGKDGMDCSFISFDFEKSTLTYAAANNPIWIVRGNEFLEFKPDKMPVGKHDRDTISFTQHTINLLPNDMVYSLTDGFPDQFGGPKGKKFKYKQLKDFLLLIADKPVIDQNENLTNIFNKWKGDLEQVDDVTFIGIRI